MRWGYAMGGTVLFVCPHGAGKSRIAAAWFAGVAPPGWSATSAGLEPQAQVSEHAPRLLAGTEVAGLLDGSLPRPLSRVGRAEVVVAIDCPRGSVPGARDWQLRHTGFDQAMTTELRERVTALVRELT